MIEEYNKLKKKFERNELVVGTTVAISSPTVTEVLGTCGYDFVWIDGEHGELDLKDINLHILAAKASGYASFARVRWNDPAIVKPILDCGPTAIIFPLINSAEEARLAVASCRYPPEGIRGYGPRRANNFSSLSDDEYLEISRKVPMVILQVEHIKAVNNLEEIVKVKGVDSLCVGPNDLSGSVGMLGQTNSPKLIELYDRIADVCKKNKMLFGFAGSGKNTDVLKAWINRGVNWCAVDWDIGHLAYSGKHSYENVMSVFKEFKAK